MATIQARPTRSGRTHYRVQIRLGTGQASATFRTRGEARQWAALTEGALRAQRQQPRLAAAQHTLADVITRYRRDILPTKQPRTAAGQAIHLAWWQDVLGTTRLRDLTPAALVMWRDALARTHAPATVNRYVSTLSHALHLAMVEWQWLEESPLRRVHRLPEPRGRVRYLTDNERTRLLQACQASSTPALYPLVVLALSTGARKMELLRLTWQNIDLRRAQITLEHTKNGERRALPLTGLALQEIARLAKVRRLGTTLVFPRTDGRKPLDIRHAWAQALQAAGITDCSFHDLRHSCASYLAMSGASLVEIAAVLGHKTLQMVQRYAHLSDAHTAGVVERMTARIFADHYPPQLG
jgi:integrase